MNTSQILARVLEIYSANKNLPQAPQLKEQFIKLGLMNKESKEFYAGCKVEALRENGRIIDLLFKVNGEITPLLGVRPAKPKVEPLNDTDFKVHISNRTYSIIGLNRTNKLRATIKLEHGKKFHVDTVNLYHSGQRERFISEINTFLHIHVETVRDDIFQLINCAEEYHFQEQQSSEVVGMNKEDKEQALKFAKSKKLVGEILEDFEKLGFVGEENNKLLSYLIATSRILKKPNSLMVLSSSGAGKSQLVNSSLRFMPPEDVISLTSLSAKALFYKTGDSLKNKILAIEEDKGSSDASYSLRALMSSDFLSVETTVRDAMDGKIKTQHNRIEASTAVFLTSTNPKTDPETKSRFIVVHVDESKAQTEKILQKQLQAYQSSSYDIDIDEICSKHHNFQRLLKPLKVLIDPALIKTNGRRLEARRNLPKLLKLIETIALLKQYQRKEISLGVIEAKKEDVELAEKLLGNVYKHECLTAQARDLLNIIKQTFKESFTRRQLREMTLWTNNKVHRCINELVDMEYLVLERKSFRHQYKLIIE